jgi:hypothetical protein
VTAWASVGRSDRVMAPPWPRVKIPVVEKALGPHDDEAELL